MGISANSIDETVQYLKGVGPKKAEFLARLGVHTIADLLTLLPVRYEDRSSLTTVAKAEPNNPAALLVEVAARGVSFMGRRRIYEIAFSDETGVIRGVWFRFAQKSIETRYPIGSRWVISGQVTFNKYRGCKMISFPDTESVEEGDVAFEGAILPVYPLTDGLRQKDLRAIVGVALRRVAELIDFTPEELNRRYKLPPLTDALRFIHNPPPDTNIRALHDAATREQKKLIFNEFFLAQSGLALKRRGIKKRRKGAIFTIDASLMTKIEKLFPFTFTPAQKNALTEIATDLRSGEPMNRLLQGDVGSGKTAVALATALMAIRNGKQAAIMAPTEILANQHFRNIRTLLGDTPVRVSLVTSGSAGKKEALNTIATGETHLVIGTHALIQEGVAFADLGLAIIDEQHRFGVRQRATLIDRSAEEGVATHALIMTATPIPRTLAMTLYGDLDLTIIDESPPGRKPIITKVYRPARRERALDRIREEVAKGRQAYIIYPLVDESEKLEDIKAATVMFEKLSREDFAEMRLGLTHGRMKSSEKEETMAQFGRGEIDILVATTVVEVGVDQPNATLIMIENPERFGLSQLHQLRGRVGRNDKQSWCLLMASERTGKPGYERLTIMTSAANGFAVAEADLALRGAGDFFGVKQSGLPEFRIGDIVRDHKILTAARKAAFALIEKDPGLTQPEHKNLAHALNHHWRDTFELGSIG